MCVIYYCFFCLFCICSIVKRIGITFSVCLFVCVIHYWFASAHQWVSSYHVSRFSFSSAHILLLLLYVCFLCFFFSGLYQSRDPPSSERSGGRSISVLFCSVAVFSLFCCDYSIVGVCNCDFFLFFFCFLCIGWGGQGKEGVCLCFCEFVGLRGDFIYCNFL